MILYRSVLTVGAGKRSKWIVLLLWLVVATIAGPFAGKLQDAEKNDQVSFLPSSADSTQVIELQKRFAGSGATPAVIVYRRSAGLTPSDRTRVAADSQAIRTARVAGVTAVNPPIPSRDGKALLIVVPIVAKDDVAILSNAVDAIRKTVGQGRSGLDVKVTGAAGFSADAIKVFASIDTKLLLATVLLVAVLLLLIYRSPFLWVVPLITLGFAEALAEAGAYAMARAGFVVNGQTSGLMTILVFGAGTDYALLLVARYREELRQHEDRHEAMRYALGQAGPSILASGGTVALALLSLLAAELNNNRGLGPIERSGNLARFSVVVTAPPYGDSAFSDVSRLRDYLQTAVGGAALVGGPTAQELDTRLASVRDAKVIVPLVLLVVLVILAALLRSLTAPLVLIGTVIVSFAAALGFSVCVFEWVFGFPGVDPSFPLLSFIFLVALGVDYNIFLMARAREEAERVGTERGMLTALAVTGGVITSAGIVLAGTFAVLGVLPLVALTEIGFVVAFGVLLDTLVVRTILVPAITLDIGPRIWWPSVLSKQEGGPTARRSLRPRDDRELSSVGRRT